MKFTEKAIVFSCAGEDLLGIVALPDLPNETGILFVVGGPQYRAGSHRQFLLLSRAMAAVGYPVMRFDHSGMGDSSGALKGFETLTDDISAAISAFKEISPTVSKVVLWGLCDAASASLLYWDTTHDSRIVGMVLLNPWVRSEATFARTHIKHYYVQRLLQLEFWRKLVRGRLGVGRALGDFINSVKRVRQQKNRAVEREALPFQKRMLRGLEDFQGQVLILLSENDYTAKEFSEVVRSDSSWARTLNKNNLTRIEVSGADHTFSSAEWRKEVESLTLEWLKKG